MHSNSAGLTRTLHFGKYSISGLIVYTGDFGVYCFVLWLSSEYYQSANIAGKIVGGTLGFMLHKYSMSANNRWGPRNQLN